MPHSLQGLSSLTRDWTRALAVKAKRQVLIRGLPGNSQESSLRLQEIPSRETAKTQGHWLLLSTDPGKQRKERGSTKQGHKMWKSKFREAGGGAGRAPGLQSSPLPWTCLVILDNFPHLSEPQCPHLWNSFYLVGSCCSATKSCLTLCDTLDCSMPGFPVLYYSLEFVQIHVPWVHDAI